MTITTRLCNEVDKDIIQCAEEAENQRSICGISVEQDRKGNDVNCNCRWKKCKRHGKCEECIVHHSKHIKHPLPSCMKK